MSLPDDNRQSRAVQLRNADGAAVSMRIAREVLHDVNNTLMGVLGCAKAALAKLNPTSPIVHIEYANGLLMLFGDKEEDKAVKLYEKAGKMKAKDAMDVLDIAMANNELED